MKINGKWYFNETLNETVLTSGKTTISFSSNGAEYAYMYQESIPSILNAIYYLPENHSVGGPDWIEAYSYYDRVGYTAGFTNEAYRTIDFGAAYQEVSDEFYSWLTANAVQLSKPIPMTHPKGIKLLTKGHKLSKDLEVVPTFAENIDVSVYDEGGVGLLLIYTTIENGSIVATKLTVTDTDERTIKVLKNSAIYIYKYGGYYDSNSLHSFTVEDVEGNVYGACVVAAVEGLMITTA